MRKTFYCLSFVLTFFFSTANAELRQLHIGISTGYPPFYFFTENQQPTGICIDVVRHVAAQMNVTVTFTSYPWKRMLQYGKEGVVDAVLPLFQTPERDEFLFFPKTALIEEDNRLFTSAKSTLNYAGDLAEIKNRKIAVVDGFSYGPVIDQTDFANKSVVQTTEQLILLVQGERVDFGIGNSKVVSYTARQMKIADKLRFLSPPVTVAPLFIGFSKAVSDPGFVARFSQQLQRFKQTQAYAEIVQKYGDR